MSKNDVTVWIDLRDKNLVHLEGFRVKNATVVPRIGETVRTPKGVFGKVKSVEYMYRLKKGSTVVTIDLEKES